MLYSANEVREIKDYQTKDPYGDIVDLKNTALVENLKQRNMIDIEQHYKA